MQEGTEGEGRFGVNVTPHGHKNQKKHIKTSPELQFKGLIKESTIRMLPETLNFDRQF